MTKPSGTSANESPMTQNLSTLVFQKNEVHGALYESSRVVVRRNAPLNETFSAASRGTFTVSNRFNYEREGVSGESGKRTAAFGVTYIFRSCCSKFQYVSLRTEYSAYRAERSLEGRPGTVPRAGQTLLYATSGRLQCLILRASQCPAFSARVRTE
jgi:hypothetical protein